MINPKEEETLSIVDRVLDLYQHDQATEKQQLVFTLVFSCLELAENRQGCILSPCLFNLYAEYIMRNAGLDEVQAGIKIAGRNINNLRYGEDTTLLAESEEEQRTS